MKIGPLDPKIGIAPANAERPSTAARGAAGTPAAPEASAKVELSTTASLLTSGSGGEFDAEKVQRIAQAIRDGKFEVNAEAIADKLIANAQELLSRGQR